MNTPRVDALIAKARSLRHERELTLDALREELKSFFPDGDSPSSSSVARWFVSTDKPNLSGETALSLNQWVYNCTRNPRNASVN